MSSKNPWTLEGVAISLSASRRAALKAFADSAGSAPPLAPAQALYSLIDLINPAEERLGRRLRRSWKMKRRMRPQTKGQIPLPTEFPAPPWKATS